MLKMKTLRKLPLDRLMFFACLLTFAILLMKNPFSQRSLIPNLEPYPDSIHYLNPVKSFIEGNGFTIEREGRTFKPTVPFLYSLTLVPGYAIYNDVRVFYFTNILLAFTGFVFFYIFLKRISENKYIPPLLSFFYVTNYFIFWYPNLPMAENLGLTLFNLSLFLLTSKSSLKNIILVSITAVSLYATKYANFTLSAVLVIAYFIKIYLPGSEKLDKKLILKRSKPALTLILTSVLTLLIFFAAEYLIRGESVFLKIQHLIEPLVSPPKTAVDLNLSNPWFSYSYFNRNFPVYTSSLIGTPVRFLWDYTPLLPKYLSVMAIAGLLAGLIYRSFRFIGIYLFLFILAPILFLSTFYTVDTRYIYHVIPAEIAGITLLLNIIYKLSLKIKKIYLFYVLLILLFGFYSLTNFTRLKYQAVLNLKYAETPWNYLSVQNFNNFFKDSSSNNILITAMNPYYIDFYISKNPPSSYKLLPLSTEQEFSGIREIAWGEEDYTDFINIYKKYLNNNYNLYVSNAGLGNEPYLHRDFNLIKENFELEKVNEGCLDTCNIYKLKLKP